MLHLILTDSTHLTRIRHADCICLREGKIRRANQHDTSDITCGTEVKTVSNQNRMRDVGSAWSQPIRLQLFKKAFAIFVCNIQHYLGKPERRWRPSTFWLMRYLRCPALCSCSRAMWVTLGRASSNVVLKWGFSPLSSIVHTPLGPLIITDIRAQWSQTCLCWNTASWPQFQWGVHSV